MVGSDEEWERSKENIQPIEQGRKQKVLKVALAPHPEDVIMQQRQAFEHELRTYSGTDILSVWCRYIKWVEQNFPKGGREGQIKQLIERCLAVLKDEKKYYDDERFVNILLKFSNMTEKPLDVFNYMYSHRIGCKLAKFFISWAWELEQFGNFKKANQVLNEGIKRPAEPLEKLKAYQKDFDARLTSKVREVAENPSIESNSRRSAFSMLKPQKQKIAPIERTGEAVIDKKKPVLLGQQSQPNPVKSSASSKVPFKIYNAENIAPSLPVQSTSVAPALSSFENSKENEQKPSKWNKVKVKPRVQSIRLPNEMNPVFKFHCDEESASDTFTPRSVPKTSTVLSTRHRSPSPVMALFELPDPLKKPMYPKKKVYGGVVEYSLEEIRAAEWSEKKRIKNQELLLKEQDKLLKLKAKENEELEKEKERMQREIDLLTKKMQMLESSKRASDLMSRKQDRPNIMHSLPEDKNSEIRNMLTSESEQNVLFMSSTSKVELENFPNCSYKSKLGSDYITEPKKDSTSYRVADKMVQELYNRSLFHSDQSESKTSKVNAINCIPPHTTPDSAIKYPSKKPDLEMNTLSTGLSFELFHDPTTHVSTVSNSENHQQNTIVSSYQKSGSNQLTSLVEKGKPVKEKSLPFMLYHDTLTNMPVLKSVEIPSHLVVSSKSSGQTQSTSSIQGSGKIKSHMPLTFYHDASEEIKALNKPSLSSNFIEPKADVLQTISDSKQPTFLVEKDKSVILKSLPFELYHDPTTNRPVLKNVELPLQLAASSIPSSQRQSTLSIQGSGEIKSNMPFTFYHDATEEIKALSKSSLPEPKSDALQTFSEKNQENDENIPPRDYIQKKEQRELAGILEPSKNIVFIPLEDQLDSQEEDDDDEVCHPRVTDYNETLIPPSNTEQFSTDLFLSSTPCASRRSGRKPPLTEPVGKTTSSPETKSPEAYSMPPPQNMGNSQLGLPKMGDQSCRGGTLGVSLPKVLSTIMETSSENYSKSSSSSNSSASLTKSSHLDPSHLSSARRPKLDTLSSITEVPDSVFSVSHTKHDKISEENEKFELHAVDFDPFDPEETLRLLKLIDLNPYDNLHYVDRSIKCIKADQNVPDTDYRIHDLIAQGAYAKVYLASKLNTKLSSNPILSFGEYESLNYKIALKVCKDCNEWEFFITHEIARRLARLNRLPDVKKSFMNVTSAVKFTDGIALETEYSSEGTLLDVINHYKKKSASMPETLVMYLTYEILHIVSRLHELNIVHGDIKPDNFLLMNTAFGSEAVNHLSQSTSTLRLIDFGRAIDLCQYKRGICFTTELKTTLKCIEMRESKAWVFQLDWYGALCCIYAMLFSEYLSVRKRNEKWETEKKFKRYWYTSLWEPLFSELLNIPACYVEPNIKKFTDLIEARLLQNSKTFVFELQRLSTEYSVNKKT